MLSLLDEIRDRHDCCHDLYAKHINPKMMSVLRLMGSTRRSPTRGAAT